MLTRREFLQTGAAAAGFLLPGAEAPIKRLAIIATIYKYLSHAQHIGDRFLVGYPYAGAWQKPAVKVVSLYVDQKPEGDLSGERAREFGFQVYPTIAEALCHGGKELAVDAVLIVAEHGDYPRNEKGQILYPRYEFFRQCTEVFKRSGRSVPVYNDKHLSYSFVKAKSMVETSRRLGVPLLRAGFPQYDLLGGYQRLWVGYRGTRQALFDLSNLMTEHGHHETEPYVSIYHQGVKHAASASGGKH